MNTGKKVFLDVVPRTPKRPVRAEKGADGRKGPYETPEERKVPLRRGTKKAAEKIAAAEEALEADAVFEAPDERQREEKSEAILGEIFNKAAEKERETQKKREKRERPKPFRPRFSGQHPRRTLVIAGGVLCALVAIGAWLACSVLPQATITIVLAKTSIPVNETVTFSTAATATDISGQGIVVPGEVLNATQNTQMTFAANGEEATSSKAAGTLTVVNAFNSSPQTLVAGTRFATPDGLVFRTTERVVVPAARVASGTVTPESIDTAAVADASGEQYNVPAGTKWTIPGFKGTPRYDGFYAMNSGPMTGGASGTSTMPTQEDMAGAKTSVETAIENALKAKMGILLSSDLMLLPGATTSTITKETEAAVEGNPSSFSLYAEGTMQEFVFSADALKQAIVRRAGTTLPSGVGPVSFDVSYGAPSVNFAKGTMTLVASGTVVFAEDIDTGAVAKSIAGLNEDAVRRAVFSLPGLENATISLSPFWVHAVPADTGKIHIAVK